MPKPAKELDTNTGLFTFMLLNDVANSINNPKKWITESHLAEFVQRIAEEKANGDEISRIAESMFGKPRGKAEARSKMQSIAAKIKADKNLSKKVWAIAYFRHKQIKGMADKALVAEEIRNLLIKHFPDDVPSGNATKAGQIPSAKTIATRWLHEAVKKT
jgi:predicted transcriptional regulator